MMLKNIQAYKLSYVLMAVNELDLFEVIDSSPKTVFDIALERGLNPLYLELLLNFLKSYSFLQSKDDKWYLSKEFKVRDYASYLALKDIIRYESHIAQQWITPEKIIGTLLASDDERPFEKKGWTEEGLNLYKNATYADNLKYISVIVHMYIRKFVINNIYPEGEGAKYLKDMIQKRYKDILEESENTKNTAILLYNKIHYLNSDEVVELCHRVEDANYLIIADFFMDEQNRFLNNLAIDWLTHGGTNFINKTHLYEVCNKNGLEIVESKFLERIHTDIILLKIGRGA